MEDRVKKIILLIFIIILATSGAKASSELISAGDVDMTKYKTFSVVSSTTPETPEFLRELPIIQNLTYHLCNEGYTLVNDIRDADFVATAFLYDDVQKKYIPPTTYSTTTYNYQTNTTDMSGLLFGTGNFINFSGTAKSESTGTATTTTHTVGGYFVYQYGISVIINIYDGKTQKLKWSGAGASLARQSNSLPYVDSVISDLIREKLITPAYITNTRKKKKLSIEKLFTNEYLKPILQEKEYYSPVVVGDNIKGMDYVVNVLLEGQTLNISVSGTNNTDKPITIDPEFIRVTVDDMNGYVLKKSELMNVLFKSGEVDVSETKSRELGGMIGAFFSPFSDLLGTSSKAKKERRDETIRFMNERYLEKTDIDPGETNASYLYAILPFYLLGRENIAIEIMIDNEIKTSNFIYEKKWMTAKKYHKWLKKNMQ